MIMTPTQQRPPEWLRVTYKPRNALLPYVVKAMDLNEARNYMLTDAREFIDELKAFADIATRLSPMEPEAVYEWVLTAYNAIVDGAFVETREQWVCFIKEMRAKGRGKGIVVLDAVRGVKCFRPLLDFKLPLLCGWEAVECKARILPDGIMDIVPLGFDEGDYEWDGKEVTKKLL